MRPKLKPGAKAPDFALPSVAGTTVRLVDQLARHRATVVLFISNHCPYVAAYIPRLIQLQSEFSGKARFVGICSNDAHAFPEDSFEKMKLKSQDWGLNFPYLRDEDQSVARAYGAERTPEVFVLDSNGLCRYEGGIDDNYQHVDKVKQRPLRDAIQALVDGKAVAQPQTYALGCTIKWKK